MKKQSSKAPKKAVQALAFDNAELVENVLHLGSASSL